MVLTNQYKPTTRISPIYQIWTRFDIYDLQQVGHAWIHQYSVGYVYSFIEKTALNVVLLTLRRGINTPTFPLYSVDSNQDLCGSRQSRFSKCGNIDLHVGTISHV